MTATETAMALLTPLMTNGRMKSEDAEKVLLDHHACRLVTLCRARLLARRGPYVMTIERWEREQEMARKRARIVELKRQIAELEKELKNLQKPIDKIGVLWYNRSIK